jgi:hypothetical protein
MVLVTAFLSGPSKDPFLWRLGVYFDWPIGGKSLASFHHYALRIVHHRVLLHLLSVLGVYRQFLNYPGVRDLSG